MTVVAIIGLTAVALVALVAAAQELHESWRRRG